MSDRPNPTPIDDATRLAQARELAIACARDMADSNCSDVVVLDVSAYSTLTHFVVLGTGTSDRQMRSVARDLGKLAEESSFPVMGQDEDSASVWIVQDFIDVMIHVFEPETRELYDLESLHGEATEIDWQ